MIKESEIDNIESLRVKNTRRQSISLNKYEYCLILIEY